MARKPTPNAGIDALVRNAIEKAKDPDCQIDIILDVVKVAAMWEKVKYTIKSDGQGSFFNGSDDEEED